MRAERAQARRFMLTLTVVAVTSVAAGAGGGAAVAAMSGDAAPPAAAGSGDGPVQPARESAHASGSTGPAGRDTVPRRAVLSRGETVWDIAARTAPEGTSTGS